ncbi:hypothetical protein E2P81_ATG00342 [Venturia nashicola]|nr:hypothetical protein E2P81_ATG00342 [Venturia nashicola]
MSNQPPTSNNPTTNAKLPTRADIIRDLKEVDISTIPETTVNAWCNCIRSLVNKKHAPKFKLENRCPKCRRELFQSKTDERLFALRDDILEARRRVVYSTWDTRETLLSKESVTGILCGLDGIINRGAEIGDVYDHEEYLARDAFNGALVVNWWKCMMENHLVYFMHTMAEPVTHALMQLVRQHGLCTYDADGGVSTNPFVEIRIGLDEVEAHAATYSRFYEFFFTAEQGRSGRPSSRSDVIDNSMMPSQLFLKTMVLLQR